MDAIDKFDYTLTKRRAKGLLKRLRWNLVEQDVLIDDMVQNAALELIKQNDLNRFSFIIGKAFMDTVIEWRFQVPASSHRTRLSRGQDNKELVFTTGLDDIDLSSFKLHNYSLDVERTAMARECIDKMLSGKLESYKMNTNIEKRKEACRAMLISGSSYIHDGQENRKFGTKVLKYVRKLTKTLINEHI